METSWRTRPIVRIAGSALGWFGFVLCFGLLFQVSLLVIGLGGSCASGGPYVNAVECPENVIVFAPLSIWGGLAAVGIWLFFAGGFGIPLPGWAWFILFAGLSIPFAIGGDVVNAIIAVLFVGMGAVPIYLELKANPARAILGSRDIHGNAFHFTDNSRRSMLSMRAPEQGTVAPNVGHWLLGLGVPIAASALGVIVAMAPFG